jgi:hypothetical protein
MRRSARVSIIACEVFRAELELLLAELQLPSHVHFLPQGLHDTPDKLGVQLQSAIDELEAAPEPPEAIILCYGLCGRGVSGVFARRATLVVPKVHDCIPVLLGVSQARKDALHGSGATFWMSPGWLRYSQVPFVENRATRFADYKKKFDPDAAQYLMDLEGTWLSEYDAARVIRWNEWADMAPTLMDDAGRVADDAGLPLHTIPGHKGYLTQLLCGGEDPALFLHLPPGSTLTLSVSGDFIAAPLNKAV